VESAVVWVDSAGPMKMLSPPQAEILSMIVMHASSCEEAKLILIFIHSPERNINPS
jgi:hypothetical protein